MENDSRKGGVKGGHAVPIADQFPGDHHLPHQTVHYRNHAHDDPEQWPKGLTNVGNTCYANAALQCLLSTALTNALLDPKVVPLFRRYSSNPNLLAKGSGSVDDEDEDEIILPNSRKASSDPIACPNVPKAADAEDERLRRKQREEKKMQETSQWLTRELTAITQEYTNSVEPVSGSSYMGWLSSSTPPPQDNAVDPGIITRHPDRLSKCLRPYQQEDAHEFLRALISTLVMNGHNKQLSSLFDGLLESSVTCKSCGRASLTRDRYMDLSLDINTPEIQTLDDALFEYTKTETLEADNAVFCQKCNKKRAVNKGLRLATAPSILVCHLKRFAFDNYGRMIRLHKKIQFPERLEIGEFMSNLNKARPPPYDLVGILVHQGRTCASGHYLAFVKKNEQWYKCNDSVVTKVDKATVFDQQAYILMYEVAEMRERTGCTPQAKVGKSMPDPFDDEYDAETCTKDGLSTNACSSWRSSERSARTSQSSKQQPYQRLLRFLNGTDGITQFFSEMCCDSSPFKEPKTHELKRNRRHSCDSAKSLRRSFSNESLKVIEVQHKNGNRGVRSQTAPRQRTQSYDKNNNFTGFHMDSPRTTMSTRSDGKSRQRSASRDCASRGYGRHSTKAAEKRGSKGERERSRSYQNLAASGELPPLPRNRRAISNASSRLKGGSKLKGGTPYKGVWQR